MYLSVLIPLPVRVYRIDRRTGRYMAACADLFSAMRKISDESPSNAHQSDAVRPRTPTSRRFVFSSLLDFKESIATRTK